jgi:hypothetical protein
MNNIQLKCFLCETKYDEKRFHYYDKDFCSVLCMKIQRTEDIRVEEEKEEENKKNKPKHIFGGNLKSGGGSAY